MGTKIPSFSMLIVIKDDTLILIRGFRDDIGVWQTENSKMADLVVEYLQTLFTSSNPGEECINSCLASLEAVITDDMNELLIEDFFPNRVFQAL